MSWTLMPFFLAPRIPAPGGGSSGNPNGGGSSTGPNYAAPDAGTLSLNLDLPYTAPDGATLSLDLT